MAGIGCRISRTWLPSGCGGMKKGEGFQGPWLESLTSPWEMMRSPSEKIRGEKTNGP